MTTMLAPLRHSGWAVCRTLARGELVTLWRARTPVIFYFALPALLSGLLGPAVSGLDSSGAGGRAMLGWAVMFSFMSMNYTGRALYREFWSDAWRKNALVEESRMWFLLGKAAPVILVTTVQLLTFLVVAIAITDLSLPSGPVAVIYLLPILVLQAMAGSAVGLLMFAVIRSAETYFSLSYLVLITFATLGGAIVAAPELPSWSRSAGWIVPHRWSLRAVDATTADQASWQILTESCLVLALFVAVVGGLAARRFDYRVEHFGDG